MKYPSNNIGILYYYNKDDTVLNSSLEKGLEKIYQLGYDIIDVVIMFSEKDKVFVLENLEGCPCELEFTDKVKQGYLLVYGLYK